jgi:antitoxin VapB
MVEMSLNIRNPETHRLAQELAELTGESMSAAVTVAIRERLNRCRKRKGKSLAEELIAIGKDCASRMREPYLSIDHGDFLYDENGLPR